MRKIIVSITTIIIFSFTANAQIEEHAIGVRLGGGNYGGGFEASYQYADINNARYSNVFAFSKDQTYKDKSF